MPVASLVKHWKRFTQGRSLQSRPGTVVFIVDLSVNDDNYLRYYV